MKRLLAALLLATSLAVSGCTGSSADLVIGSANFPESQLLAEIYTQALEAKNVKVAKRLNIGSREVYLQALRDGSIDAIPEYTGNLLLSQKKDATEVAPDAVYAALRQNLPAGLTVLDKSPAEDKDAIVVTRATADKYQLKTIADLVSHAAELTLGAPAEFQTRPYGVAGLARNYGLTFAGVKALEPGTITTKALQDNTIQAADIFSTDPSITSNNFVVLDDPKNNFAAQNVVPLLSDKKLTDTIRGALNAVSAKLTTPILADLNARLAAPDKPDAAKIAKDWLTSVALS